MINLEMIERVIARKNYICELLDCQKKLLTNVCSHDEQIEMLAYQRISKRKDLSDLLNEVQQIETSAKQDLALHLREVNIEIETAVSIQLCFEISRLIYPEGYELCKDLLIFKYTWDYVMCKHHISRGNINSRKQRELVLVQMLFCMKVPNRDLLRQWRIRFVAAQQADSEVTLDYVIRNPGTVLTADEMKKAVWT